MITGIPNYTDRAIQSLRCKCGIRFVVLVGNDSPQAARMDALRLNAEYVDARRLLAFDCYCGMSIDVSPEGSLILQ